MDYFIKHRLIKSDNGYTLVLNLDKQLSEFARDFDSIDNEERESFEESIRTYINKRLPNVAIKIVNVMLGALLVVSIPINTIDTGAVSSRNKIDYEKTVAKGYQDYTVQSGDTLYKIGQRYDVRVGDLKTINNLNSGLIYVGQALKIPEIKKVAEEIQYFNYTVKSGDCIYRIARQFDVSIHSIKLINNIEGNTIIVGQLLRIPNSNSAQLISNPNHLLVISNKKNRLPENYIPENLVVPNVDFPFREYHSKKLMRQDAAKALEGLFREAERDGIDIYATSGYRSYGRQEYIFTSKVMERGIYIANETSAKPGESEHQTGLSMDVTSPRVDFNLTQSFGDTLEGKWLVENAPKYGFIIRYPEGKEDITGYSYEPWHLRYVGENAAEFINNENITLEEYLGKF